MDEDKISHEELDFGPIHIERTGRVIRINSNWKECEHQKFMSDIRNKRPELKKEIDDKIDELLQAVKAHNPFELLTPISIVNLTSDPETYTEITHTGNESIVEYLFSIIASLPFPASSKKPTAEIIQKTIDLLKEIQNKIIWYYSSEIAEGKLDEKEAELRFRLMNYSLMVRGHSYPQHVEKTFLELFSPHDEFLKEKIGFSSKQFLEFVKKICDQIENNINKTRNDGLKPFHQAFKTFQSYAKDNQKLNSQELIESFKKENKTLIEECQKNIGYLNDLGGPEVFKIILNNAVDKRIIESISIKLEENKNFLELKDNRCQPLKGWFLNPSLIYEKPIIFHENTFFCFHPQVLFRNISFILEKLIERNDKEYLKKFYESRDNYLENKGIEIISDILKIEGSKVYRNLHYNGFELDGLIKYDDVLILIEAKAGKLSESAKRGSIKSFMNDMKNDLLGKAYGQGNRALEYIKKTEGAKFFDKNGNELLDIKKKDYNHFFVISLYFEPIGHIITNLSLMKELGVVSNEKHWAVYLNDLRVISEIVDCPSLFIHYLTRRLEVNRFSQLDPFDELDTFMLYLREGLYFEEFPKDLTKIQFTGYTEDLDKYYLYLEGKRSKVEKPSQKMPEYFKKLIEKLETKRPRQFTTVSIELLNCDENTREKISEQIERCESDHQKDKKIHSVSLIFEKPGLALLLSTLPSMELEKHAEMLSGKYLQDKMIKRVIMIYWAPKIENTEKGIHVYARGYNHE